MILLGAVNRSTDEHRLLVCGMFGDFVVYSDPWWYLYV